VEVLVQQCRNVGLLVRLVVDEAVGLNIHKEHVRVVAVGEVFLSKQHAVLAEEEDKYPKIVLCVVAQAR